MEDGEIQRFIKVWTIATTCLCYCYYIASRIPKGILKLLSLLPIFYLFIILPLDLTSFHLGGPTAFFLVWLAIFKLLLSSFDQGPLSLPPPQSLVHFIAIACLPIKPKQDLGNAQRNKNPSHEDAKERKPQTHFMPRPILLLPIKAVLLAIIFHSYNYKQHMHSYLILTLYCVHMYIELEIVLALSAIPARTFFGFELERQFNEPYLATSLQDFWGQRWNLMVTGILRPTVYNPIRRFSRRFIGKWAPLPAVVAAFVVSGLMHEVIFFYLSRVSPTWEVTCFFVLHGICVAMEVVVKKVVKDRWVLRPVISGPLTLGFVGLTAVWLFFPQLRRNGLDDKAIGEYSTVVNFIGDKIKHYNNILS